MIIAIPIIFSTTMVLIEVASTLREVQGTLPEELISAAWLAKLLFQVECDHLLGLYFLHYRSKGIMSMRTTETHCMRTLKVSTLTLCDMHHKAP